MNSLPPEKPIQSPSESTAESPAESPLESQGHKLPGQKLKARQERFCQNYVLSANAAGSAHEAGYSPRSARKQGYRYWRWGASAFVSVKSRRIWRVKTATIGMC
ncbi:MAG: terminase small subunit [Rhodospirillales bacterium]|nr:terminase small subunit [Rhodospirillales bacterium]